MTSSRSIAVPVSALLPLIVELYASRSLIAPRFRRLRIRVVGAHGRPQQGQRLSAGGHDPAAERNACAGGGVVADHRIGDRGVGCADADAAAVLSRERIVAGDHRAVDVHCSAGIDDVDPAPALGLTAGDRAVLDRDRVGDGGVRNPAAWRRPGLPPRRRPCCRSGSSP